MIAGGLDQEALNFLVYFERRRLFVKPLPYADIADNVDIEDDQYIDWFTKYVMKIASFLSNKLLLPVLPFRPRNGPTNWDGQFLETPYWEHSYMMTALIKYKRLQELCVEREISHTKMASFLVGTHSEIGKNSPVNCLRGNRSVLEYIRKLVEPHQVEKRIKSLVGQVIMHTYANAVFDKVCSFKKYYFYHFIDLLTGE